MCGDEGDGPQAPGGGWLGREQDEALVVAEQLRLQPCTEVMRGRHGREERAQLVFQDLVDVVVIVAVVPRRQHIVAHDASLPGSSRRCRFCIAR